MTWKPEMEIVAQLEGGALPLSVAERVFGDRGRAAHVLAIYIAKRVCALAPDSESDNDALPLWQAKQVLSKPESWQQGTPWRIRLTDKGLRAWSGGTWEQI